MNALLTEPLRAPQPCGTWPGFGAAGIVRRPWRQAAHGSGRVPSWCFQCAESGGDEAWDEATAPYILSEPERRIWHRLPRAAARRQWMRGRVAAKDAVRLLALERYHLAVPWEGLCILPDEHGQPVVSGHTLPDGGAGLCVSIAHCANRSVALVTERSELCRRVGIDIASLADPHDGLAEGGFASAELSLLNDCPAPERSDWLLCLWCAKEAVGKALGVGLQGNPLNFGIVQINRAWQTVEVEARVRCLPTAPSAQPVRMTVPVGCDQGLAFAVARQEGT